MEIFWIIVLGILGIVLVTVGATAAVLRLTKRRLLAGWVGSLFVPSAIVLSLIYWLDAMEPDDPAPGNVIFGALAAMAVLVPITCLVSVTTLGSREEW